MTNYPGPEASPASLAFFVKFARFEYAMKRSSFRRPGIGYVRPDWNDFARRPEVQALEESLLQNEKVQKLFANPPKRLEVMPHGVVEWAELPAHAGQLASLVRAVCQVRHNLFHGDKNTLGSERDDMLLEGASSALDILLEGIPELEAEFNSV